MKMNQIEIRITAHNEIVVEQIKGGAIQIVRITPDQAETVADEIKKLSKQLKEEQNNGK